MRAIDIFIAGAQRSGTSSALAYLASQPRVTAGRSREAAFFRKPAGWGGSYDRFFEHEFGRRPEGLLLAKSAGVMADPAAAERLASCGVGHVVCVLREPAARAYSAFWWARRRGHEPLESFEAALAAEPGRLASGDPSAGWTAYRTAGNYAEQIERLDRLVGRDRVHVVLFEEMIRRPRAAFEALAASAGLELAGDALPTRNVAATARSERTARLFRSGGPLAGAARAVVPAPLRRGFVALLHRLNEVERRAPPLDPALRDRLREHFRPLNQRLAERIGRDLSHWNPPASS